MKIRCQRCSGSGHVMGGGMMNWDCDECDGTGKRYQSKDEQIEDAAKEIQKSNPELSHDDAKKILTEELEKPIIKDDKNGKGKSK